MKVLLVKTSSMGDLIHTLPAVTDARRFCPDIEFDWVAEESFTEIPRWHPAVQRVLPVAMRRWRKILHRKAARLEISAAIQLIRERQYDLVIDAQGLIKSAVITGFCRGLRCGLDSNSCWEPIAALAYQRKVSVARDLHAISRMRTLFAGILDYNYDPQQLDYGLQKETFSGGGHAGPYVVFLHGTSRREKLWELPEWVRLAGMAGQAGMTVYLPWGNQEERQVAENIARQTANAIVLPKLKLAEVAALLAQATAVVGVDTGLAHLTAALNVPAVTLYIDTSPVSTGACGDSQTSLTQQPESAQVLLAAGLKVFFHRHLTADVVWSYLQEKLK